jgi:hypothetical protein
MSIGSISPFRPSGTVLLSASASSASVTLAGGGDTVVVTNLTSSPAYVRFGGDGSVTASTSDMPVLPNSRAILAVNALIAYAAAVLVSGSGIVAFSRGDGSTI